jgi:hypothetical protein
MAIVQFAGEVIPQSERRRACRSIPRVRRNGVFDETLRVLHPARDRAKPGNPPSVGAHDREPDRRAREREASKTPEFAAYVARERARSPPFGGKQV